MATILLIDDDERLRQVVCRMLRGAGHQVIEAEDGRAALLLVDGCHPQIVITDVFMPRKDGVETVKSIRDKFPQMRFLAMTGGGRGERFYSLLEHQVAAEILQKPFSQSALLSAVERLLAAG